MLIGKRLVVVLYFFQKGVIYFQIEMFQRRLRCFEIEVIAVREHES
jgi:hypothetical protein